jgi:hypothetical protein
LFVKLKIEIEPTANVDAIEVSMSAVKLDIDNPMVLGIDVFTMDFNSAK